ITVRGVLRTLRGSSSLPEWDAVKARAEKIRDSLLAMDRRDFAVVHERLKKRDYGPDDFKRHLAVTPRYEWDAFTERLLAIEVTPEPEKTRESDMVHYLASSIEVIAEIIEQVTPSDVFYDLGCGLGKVTMLV